MNQERWRQIEEIFNSAADCPKNLRSAFLDQACGSDLELRREIESLLAQENRQGDFIAEIVSVAAGTFSVPKTNEMIGRLIGPYRVTGLIGEGGMGAVFKAVRDDDQYKKEAAVKLVKRGMDTSFVLNRFRHERQILANLEHPHIARLLEGGTTEDGLPYFVMERIEGRPITDYCKENKLSLRDRLNLFRSVCEAVQYAHKNLVVHRDLKPGNILVTKDGTPKLLDFGIAKLLEPESKPEATAQTLTQVRMMTPEYASPEQALGKAVMTATDTYSLGVILYELLTGQRPYHVNGLSIAEMEEAICRTEPKKPSETAEKAGLRKLGKRLAGDLDNIVLMAMRKEPERRYQSVEQFSEDIRKHLSGRPVIAREDTVGYRIGKFVRRHKLGVTAAVLVLLSLAGGMTASIYQAQRAERRFQQVRKLANTFLFDFHQKIQNLSGSMEAQEMAAKTALEYLDNLALDAEGDTALELDLAVAYLKLADVQGNPWASNLGQADSAMKSYRKSLNLAQKLADKDPDNLSVSRTLAESYFKLGSLISVTGDKLGGQKTLLQGLTLAEKLVEEKGEVTDLRLLMNFYDRIGDTQLDTGDARSALDNYRRSQQLGERRSALQPGDDSQVSLAICSSHVGETLGEMGDLSGAIDEYRKSMTIFDALTKKQPSSDVYRRGLRIAYYWLGRFSGDPNSVNLGDRSAALEYFNKSLAIAEELAASDEKNARFRFDLAGSYRDVADILSENDPAQATELYRRALAIISELLEKAPNEYRYLTRQVLCLKGLASPLLRLGNRKDALQSLNQALDISQKLSERDPANLGIQVNLSETWNAFADYAEATGDIAGALERHNRALAIAEAAVAAKPARLYSQKQLADSYERFGKLHAMRAVASKHTAAERAADWRQSLEWHQKALAVWDRWSSIGVSSVYNITRRKQTALAIAQCEEALTALEHASKNSRHN